MRRLRGEGLAEAVGASLAGPDYEVVEPIDPKSIEALERLGVEITIDTPTTDNSKPLTLVPEYTTQDRNEVSFKDAATIRMLVDAFPGARVVQYKAPPRSKPEAKAAEPETRSEPEWDGT
jgi:hypothetical protein